MLNVRWMSTLMLTSPQPSDVTDMFEHKVLFNQYRFLSEAEAKNSTWSGVEFPPPSSFILCNGSPRRWPGYTRLPATHVDYACMHVRPTRETFEIICYFQDLLFSNAMTLPGFSWLNEPQFHAASSVWMKFQELAAGYGQIRRGEPRRI